MVSSLAFAKLPALSPLPLPANTVEVGQAVKKGWVVYEVKPGDTLAGIAARYGVDPRHIMWSSNLQGDRLQVGQRLLIPLVAVEDRSPRVPPGVEVYRVRPGDTLQGVASRYGVSVLELVSANPSLESLDRLVAGSVLYIPRKAKGLVVSLPEGQTLETFSFHPLSALRFLGLYAV